MKILAFVAACIFGGAAACHAGQIASASIDAGLIQHVAMCAVFNNGSTTQTVQVKLFDEGARRQHKLGEPARPRPILLDRQGGHLGEQRLCLHRHRGRHRQHPRHHDPAR